MNSLARKNFIGLRPPYRWGLVAAVIGMVVHLVLAYHRRPEPLGGPIAALERRVVLDFAENPPSVIDERERALAGRERSDNALRMKFCWCPPGEFTLGGGANASGLPWDGEPLRVILRRGFWMGKYEVTQGQWQQIMARTLSQQRSLDPRQPRPLGDGSRREHCGKGNAYPIYFTSYDDAEEFCFRLTEIERMAGRLEVGWVYRLPNEVEWEYACRAGTSTIFGFGNQLESNQANFDGRIPLNKASAGPYVRETRPVGSYPANAWGLHDMHGNVLEWCRNLDPASALGSHVLQNDRSLEDRTIRGGCWYYPAHRCLSTNRGRMRRNGRGSGLGFRVALVSTALWMETLTDAPNPNGARSPRLKRQASGPG